MAGLPALLLCLLASCTNTSFFLGEPDIDQQCLHLSITSGHRAENQAIGMRPPGIIPYDGCSNMMSDTFSGGVLILAGGALPMAYVHSIELAQGYTDCVHARTCAEGAFPIFLSTVFDQRSLVK